MKELICFLIILILITCTGPEVLEKKIKNKNFESALNAYYGYLDSSSYGKVSDYIIVNAKQKNDSLVILIYLGGGSYNFFKENVVDFLHYNNRDVLLLGDFPNEVIKIMKSKKLSYFEDIVKARYPTDYKKYLLDKSSIWPLMYDYMTLILVFEKNKMISSKREYY